MIFPNLLWQPYAEAPKHFQRACYSGTPLLRRVTQIALGILLMIPILNIITLFFLRCMTPIYLKKTELAPIQVNLRDLKLNDYNPHLVRGATPEQMDEMTALMFQNGVRSKELFLNLMNQAPFAQCKSDASFIDYITIELGRNLYLRVLSEKLQLCSWDLFPETLTQEISDACNERALTVFGQKLCEKITPATFFQWNRSIEIFYHLRPPLPEGATQQDLEFITDYVKDFLQPYISGRMETKKRTPMMDQLMEALKEKNFDRKQVQNLAFRQYLLHSIYAWKLSYLGLKPNQSSPRDHGSFDHLTDQEQDDFCKMTVIDQHYFFQGRDEQYKYLIEALSHSIPIDFPGVDLPWDSHPIHTKICQWIQLADRLLLAEHNAIQIPVKLPTQNKEEIIRRANQAFFDEYNKQHPDAPILPTIKKQPMKVDDSIYDIICGPNDSPFSTQRFV